MSDERPQTALATVSVVIAFIALALAIIPFFGFYGIIPAVAALVFGGLARARASRQGGAGRRRALAALWMGGLALIAGLANTIVGGA